MWFHLEPKGAGYSGALSGIALSDRVTGPYTFLKADPSQCRFMAHQRTAHS